MKNPFAIAEINDCDGFILFFRIFYPLSCFSFFSFHIYGLHLLLNIFVGWFHFISIYKFICLNKFSSLPPASSSFLINSLKFRFTRWLDYCSNFRYTQVLEVFWKFASTYLVMTPIVLGQFLLYGWAVLRWKVWYILLFLSFDFSSRFISRIANCI